MAPQQVLDTVLNQYGTNDNNNKYKIIDTYIIQPEVPKAC